MLGVSERPGFGASPTPVSFSHLTSSAIALAGRSAAWTQRPPRGFTAQAPLPTGADPGARADPGAEGGSGGGWVLGCRLQAGLEGLGAGVGRGRWPLEGRAALCVQTLLESPVLRTGRVPEVEGTWVPFLVGAKILTRVVISGLQFA